MSARTNPNASSMPNSNSQRRSGNHTFYEGSFDSFATPESSSQPPPSSSTTQDQGRSRPGKARKQEEWSGFERLQKESIRECQHRLDSITAEVAALKEKRLEQKSMLTNTVFTSFPADLLAALKDELDRQILDSGAAIAIKSFRIREEQYLLEELTDALPRPQNQEEENSEAEQENTNDDEPENPQAYSQAQTQPNLDTIYRAEDRAREKWRAAIAMRKKAAHEEIAAEEDYNQVRLDLRAALSKQAKADEADRLRRSSSEHDTDRSTKRKHTKGSTNSCHYRHWDDFEEWDDGSDWDDVDDIYCAYCPEPQPLICGYKCKFCKNHACYPCVLNKKDIQCTARRNKHKRSRA
jgi:hypothetical protein